MAQATLSLSDLIADRDTWKRRALSAEKKVDDLLDDLHDARAS
jgi:hypothetical protein